MIVKSKLQKLPESSKDYHNPYLITQISYSETYLKELKTDHTVDTGTGFRSSNNGYNIREHPKKT